jgi:hypothetical protein
VTRRRVSFTWAGVLAAVFARHVLLHGHWGQSMIPIGAGNLRTMSRTWLSWSCWHVGQGRGARSVRFVIHPTVSALTADATRVPVTPFLPSTPLERSAASAPSTVS